MKKFNYRKYLNIDELVFDLTIFLIFLSINYFKTSNSLFIESINEIVLFFLLFFTVFFSPMYLSLINTRFKIYKHQLLNRILFPISFVITILTSIFIIYVMPYYLVEYFKSSMFISFLFINFFFGIIALIIGWYIGSKYEVDKDNSKIIAIGIFTYISPLIVLLPIFSTAIIYEYSLDWFISLFFGVIILIICHKLIKHGNEKLVNFFKSSIAKDYAFPFIMAFMLTFAHELIEEIFSIQNKNASSLTILKSLVFTGILPTRIILLFSPPRKIINVLIAVCSLILLFYNLFLNFKQ